MHHPTLTSRGTSITPSYDQLFRGLSEQYRIEREIGRGGMATVYLAEDLKHHRRVAIKVLDPELAAAVGPERFLKEIELTANLQHPHILPLFGRMRCWRVNRHFRSFGPGNHRGVISEPPRSLRVHRPSVPQSIETAVLRALEKVPADRFATASDFARALTTTSDNDAVARAPAPRQGIPHALWGLLIGVVLVIGILFAWRKGRTVNETTAPARVLAVLPFTNIGDSSDAYFADGVTDAVRGKLSRLRGLDVIAGESSNEYRQSRKPLRQIAQELGASYLLTAKLRWAISPDGMKRMELNPELVDAWDDSIPPLPISRTQLLSIRVQFLSTHPWLLPSYLCAATPKPPRPTIARSRSRPPTPIFENSE